MKCPKCRGDKIKVSMTMDDSGDVEETVCADDECGWIIQRDQIVEQLDGEKIKRRRRVKPSEQPETALPPLEVEAPILTAAEMMQLAIHTRDKTLGKQSRDIVRNILNFCATPAVLLRGKYVYTFDEENKEEVPAEVIALVIKELRVRGYKPKKIPVPGKGTQVEVSWPTKKKTVRKKKRRETASAQKEPTAPKKKPTTSARSEEDIAKQAARKRKREKALQGRSKLPI